MRQSLANCLSRTAFQLICLSTLDWQYATAAPLGPEYESISESKESLHYLNAKSIRQESGLTRAWFKFVYKEPKKTAEGRSYIYQDSSFAFNCVERTYALTTSRSFDAEERVVGNSTIARADWEFNEMRPGSNAEAWMKRVCKETAVTSADSSKKQSDSISIDKDEEREWLLFPETTKFKTPATFESVAFKVLSKPLADDSGKGSVQSMGYQFEGDCASSTMRTVLIRAFNSDVDPIRDHSVSKEEATMKQWASDTVGFRILKTICSTRGYTVAAANPNKTSTKSPSAKHGRSGSGFAVSPTGHILTNEHVVTDCEDVYVSSRVLRAVKGRVVARDDRNDLALIKVDSPTASYVQFRAEPMRAGESVVALGYPLRGLLASDVNVSTGTVSALAGLRNDTSKLQIQAPVQPGNSGGPLLDSTGSIAGVVVQKLDALAVAKATGDIPQNINFAVKSEVATIFLRSSGVDPRVAVAPSTPADAATVAARGATSTYLIECNN